MIEKKKASFLVCRPECLNSTGVCWGKNGERNLIPFDSFNCFWPLCPAGSAGVLSADVSVGKSTRTCVLAVVFHRQ